MNSDLYLRRLFQKIREAVEEGDWALVWRISQDPIHEVRGCPRQPNADEAGQLNSFVAQLTR